MLLHTFLKSAKHLLATTLRVGWLYAKPSYAQDGEDLFIAKFFDLQKRGVYVDVGAHHPYRYSNTYLLWRKGWHGINIDATPGSMAAFQRVRPADVNLEVAVGASTRAGTYYVFADSALNTMSSQQARHVQKTGQSQLVRKVQLRTVPLSKLLARHLRGERVDFLNVDAEGADESILQSNDWQRFRPHLVAVEILSDTSLWQLKNNPVTVFLRKQGYELVARFSNTTFFSASE